jgi:hypothetical protein
LLPQSITIQPQFKLQRQQRRIVISFLHQSHSIAIISIFALATVNDLEASSVRVDMAVNSFLLGRRGSNLFVLLLYLISMEIVASATTGEFSVRRLRLRFEKPYLVLSAPKKAIEEEHQELIEEERKEPIVVPYHILTRVGAMENTDVDEKCSSLLKQVTEGSEVTKDEYLRFLDLLTNGNMDYDDFTKLPAHFVNIFYSTACTSGQDCVHNLPTISLASSEVSTGLLQFFCSQVMSVTFTEVSVTFAYEIRYNSANITDEEFASCLERATENLLLDSFGCPYGEDQERRLISIDQMDSSRVGVGMDPLQDELERSAFRYLDETINSFPSGAPIEAPSSAPTVGGDGCEYTISATVSSFIDIRKLLMYHPSTSKCLVRINSHQFSPRPSTLLQHVTWPRSMRTFVAS